MKPGSHKPRKSREPFRQNVQAGQAMVDAKCPYCGAIHQVRMVNFEPWIMPRVYCKHHENMRCLDPHHLDALTIPGRGRSARCPHAA